MRNESQHRSVELYVRGQPEFGTEQRKQLVIQKLQELNERDEIDSLAVKVWNKSICPRGALSGTEYHDHLLDRIDSFCDWIESEGGNSSAVYTRNTVTSSITGERYTLIDLPTMAMAVYDDDELTSVHPWHDGTQNYTIYDCLAELVSEESEAISDLSDLTQAEVR